MRRALYLAVSVYILILVVSLSAWIRSYWVADRIPIAGIGDVEFWFISDHGSYGLIEVAPWQGESEFHQNIYGRYWRLNSLLVLGGLFWFLRRRRLSA